MTNAAFAAIARRAKRQNLPNRSIFPNRLELPIFAGIL
jgi:hypothetical protein